MQRIDSIRIERVAFVFARPRACHPQEVRAVYPRGGIKLYGTFHFSFPLCLSGVASVQYYSRRFARTRVICRRGKQGTLLARRLSRLVSRYAILNFPQIYRNALVSDLATR